MITTSHAVINAVATRHPKLRPRSNVADRVALVIGGIAPDVALYVLNIGALIYYPLVDGLSVSDAHQRAMDDLYFNSPWWVAGHNLLHAPLILVALFAAASLLRSPWQSRLRFFAAGALLHSLIDVAVHHDDGPLVFFPFSWSIRFSSPVSYWDPDHYGWFFRPLDLAVTVVGVVWLARWWRTRDVAQSNESVPA